MQDIEGDMLRIHAYGKSVVVKRESVLLNDNGGVRSSRLFGGRWQRLVDHLEIELKLGKRKIHFPMTPQYVRESMRKGG